MNEIWLRIELLRILSTRNVLIEIGALAAVLAAGRFVGLQLRRRYQRQPIKTPTALTWGYFGTQGTWW